MTNPQPDKIEKKLADAETTRAALDKKRVELRAQVVELRHAKKAKLLTKSQEKRLGAAGRGLFRRAGKKSA